MHFVIKCRIHRHGYENEWHKHIWPKGMILSLAVCKMVIALSASKTVVLNLIQARMEASVGSGAQVLPVFRKDEYWPVSWCLDQLERFDCIC